MFASRNEGMNLLDLPFEIPTIVLPRVMNLADQTRLIANLSGTCQKFCNFFQPQLEKRGAEKLLSLVLKPTQENINQAKKIYCANPKLLFMEGVAKEYAEGLMKILIMFIVL